MKKVAVLQSNYIPWKGYFDLIAAVDEFILYDDMQYTRRDWRNRNQIKTPQGVQWLTVPVKVRGKYHQTIRETQIDGSEWQSSHWKAISLNYRKAPYFNDFAAILQPLYFNKQYSDLSTLNRELIEMICRYLGIDTKITCSWEYKLVDGRTERLANLCHQAGADEYISGPAAKDYVDEKIFSNMGIKLSWFNYEDYPVYPQLWNGFTHGVSIIDLLFNCGNEASLFMKHVR